MNIAQMQAQTKGDLLKDLRALLEHPEFFPTEKFCEDGLESYCFDTSTHHYQVDIKSNEITLLKYRYVTSPDGTIEDFDIESEAEIALASLPQFLKLIEGEVQA